MRGLYFGKMVILFPLVFNWEGRKMLDNLIHSVLQSKVRCSIVRSEVLVTSYSKGYSEVLCPCAQKDNYATATCLKTKKFCGLGSWNANYAAR